MRVSSDFLLCYTSFRCLTDDSLSSGFYAKRLKYLLNRLFLIVIEIKALCNVVQQRAMRNYCMLYKFFGDVTYRSMLYCQ